MATRRDFVTTMAAATAGIFVFGRDLVEAALQAPAGRRQVSIAGKRIRVIDAHAHCFVPEVEPVIKGTPLEKSARTGQSGLTLGPERIEVLDQRGIDTQVLTQQGSWWYEATDRDLAREIVRVQNERTAAFCTAHPDRFVGMASVALQFPDMAAQQLDEGVRKLGLKGGAIAAGAVAGKDLSDRAFDPFWAKAAELGVLLFMHPAGGGIGAEERLRGKGNLGNTIGNPLETTVFLSHLLFEGTFDRFPGLKICAAHAGGFLPSYLGRSQAACMREADACNSMKRPFDAYFKDQILVDTMIFREEGLRHLVAEMGVSQIVYGTDMPYPWPAPVDFILNAAFLSNGQKEAILGGNLIKLLRMTSS